MPLLKFTREKRRKVFSEGIDGEMQPIIHAEGLYSAKESQGIGSIEYGYFNLKYENLMT